MTQQNRRILVVDDNESIHSDYRKVLCPEKRTSTVLQDLDARVLGGTGTSYSNDFTAFTVDSALSGEEGLQLLQAALASRTPYALAFVDMRMDPGWNGLETIRHFWKIQPELQIVLCSAYTDFTWREINDALGATDNFVILRKPFDSIEVLQLAMALSCKWEASRQVQAQMAELDREIFIRTQQARYASEKLKEEIAAKGQPDDLFSVAFRAAPVPMAIVNSQRLAWVEVNSAFARLSGLDLDAFQSRSSEAAQLLKKQSQSLLDLIILTGSVQGVECEFKTATENTVRVHVSRKFFIHREEKHAMIVMQETVREKVAVTMPV